MRTDERVMRFVVARGARVARLFTFVIAVGMVVVGLEIAAVRASVGEGALEAGALLGSLGELGRDTTALSINGERTFAASTLLDAPLASALDRIEAHCRGEGAPLAAVPAPARASVADAALRMRTSRGGEGMVACFVATPARAHVTLWDRVRALAETSDLGELGSLQLFVARAHGAETMVVATWTGPSFRLDRAFPGDGDAPGSDPDGVPRLAPSRRLLTASAEGHGFTLRVYDIARSPSDVLGAYDAQLPAAGWEAHPAVAARRADLRAYSREDRDVILAVQPFRGGSVVSLTESAARDHRTPR